METTHEPERQVAWPRRFAASTGARVAAALLVLLVIPTVLVTLAARERVFSPFDEFAHVDYLRRIERFEQPRQGDHRESETLREEQCRGLPRVKPECPPRDATREELLRGAVAARGYSYEAQQPPLYYAVTAVLRQATRPVASDYVESARLTGIFWMCGGLALLFWALRRLGCGHYSALLGSAIVVASPAVIWQTATVNNDAATVVGAAAALLVLGWIHDTDRLRPWVIGALVAAACALLKPMFLAAFAVVAVVLVWQRWESRRLGSLTVRIGILLGGPTLAYLAWSAVFSARSLVPDSVIARALLPPSLQTDTFPWRELLPSAAKMLGVYDVGPTEVYRLPVDSPSVEALAAIITVLLLAGALVWLFHRRPATIGEQVGIVSAGALVAVGPIYLVLVYLRYSQAHGAHQRYALVLVPLLAAAYALGQLWRGRLVMGALIAVTIAAQVVALT